ncbi:hypothetical protein HPB50_015256 [Hyalomma asiaticum]|uniref:Uncharacterized protein n=1 Tax=Hyalomma asiaticum TaxID=266040 RepID=A0ACB7RIV7_HYAAI|nr:hypothetical protein HPB50_015256 [Hyalomma asiaticum]
MPQRRIQEGRYQHIVYSEWLPWQLGPEVMAEYDLRVSDTGRTSYDDTLDATLSNEFSSAHFRYAHTNIPGAYWRVVHPRGNIQTQERRSHHKNWHHYKRCCAFSAHAETSAFFSSAMTDSCAMDHPLFGDHGVTHYLFRQPWLPYGQDLFATDIQRARDHGVRPYVDWVQLCQNISITGFADLSQVMPEETARLFEQVYE